MAYGRKDGRTDTAICFRSMSYIRYGAPLPRLRGAGALLYFSSYFSFSLMSCLSRVVRPERHKIRSLSSSFSSCLSVMIFNCDKSYLFYFLATKSTKDSLNGKYLPPFSLIRDFGKQNTRGNVSQISIILACYRQIGSKSTNHSH